MSTSYAHTTYTASIIAMPAEGGMSQMEIDFRVQTNEYPMTDELALALVKAIKGVGWAPGTTFSVSLSKDVQSDESYSVNFSADTPVFE